MGASLLSETWPSKWRPWIAAVLQTGVNVGILAAGFANFLLADAPPRFIFLVGILPAIMVLWIRRAVPETSEWRQAKASAAGNEPGIAALFQGEVFSTTWRVILVCAISLTAHWAFMFWHQQHLRNLPDVLAMSAASRNKLATVAMYLVIGSSIAGNFFAGWLALRTSYKAAIAWMLGAYFLAMLATYGIPRTSGSLLWMFPWIGFFQGAFALFTMYLPPLFPTLLRTTGAGFCYNIGRVTAAAGTVLFGMFVQFGANAADYRKALLYAGCLFPFAALCALLLPRGPITSPASR